VLSKAGFAKLLGVTPGRVSQMVEKGLPLTPSGKVPVAEGRAWYEANIRQRKRAPDPAGETDRARLERIRADQAELELARARGALVDRREVERHVFARARAERDAHLAWVARVAPAVATEIGADPAALFAALDREMRRHLEQLAETPAGELSP